LSLEVNINFTAAALTHFHLVPRSKNEWRYTSAPPILLHVVVLS